MPASKEVLNKPILSPSSKPKKMVCQKVQKFSQKALKLGSDIDSNIRGSMKRFFPSWISSKLLNRNASKPSAQFYVGADWAPACPTSP